MDAIRTRLGRYARIRLESFDELSGGTAMLLRIVILCACVQVAFAQPATTAPAAPEITASDVGEKSRIGDMGLERKTWTVDKVERTALIYVPKDATKKDTPVVFAFHGHGGSARQAALSFHMHKE